VNVAEQVDNSGRLKRGLPTRLTRSDAAQSGIATVFATYLRLVKATSRLTSEPRPSEDIFNEYAPLIATTWHGLAFLLPLVRPESRPVDVLVSRDSEAEKIARMLLQLGCGVIRGSGVADPTRMFASGGVAGFRGMRSALERGRTVAMTADFLGGPRRKVSLGVVALARARARPIVPVAFVSSRRIERSTWDRTLVSLPFGRTACVFGDAVNVPAAADDVLLEKKRREVEATLNAVTDRAYDIADQG
jgi:lysophospholipid acyltransferase (LPLAT)-like uncharacterized protein